MLYGSHGQRYNEKVEVARFTQDDFTADAEGYLVAKIAKVENAQMFAVAITLESETVEAALDDYVYLVEDGDPFDGFLSDDPPIGVTNGGTWIEGEPSLDEFCYLRIYDDFLGVETYDVVLYKVETKKIPNECLDMSYFDETLTYYQERISAHEHSIMSLLYRPTFSIKYSNISSLSVGGIGEYITMNLRVIRDGGCADLFVTDNGSINFSSGWGEIKRRGDSVYGLIYYESTNLFRVTGKVSTSFLGINRMLGTPTE